jgi:hypothetical protein
MALHEASEPLGSGALMEAGFTDGEVAEIVAAVVLNIYRNYFNLVAGPELDFPVANKSTALG